jgi:hypothetical protein
MEVRINRNHFSPSEISIPDGEPFREFRSHADGRRRIRPQGRFIILADSEEVVRGGGETWTIKVPAGIYEMINSGNTYCHAIIRRVGDIA